MAENIYETEGDYQLHTGDNTGAIKSYTQAIEQEPNNAKLYLKRAAAEDIEGMADEFFEDYTKATKLAPNTAEFYYAKSHLTYSFGEGNSPSKKDKLEALSYADKAIELDPNYAAVYDWRAFLKKELEDYQGALEDHNKAIELTNDYYNYYFFRGETYLKLKDYGAAIQDYTKAIGLNPNCSIAYNQRSFAKKEIGDAIGAKEDSKEVEINKILFSLLGCSEKKEKSNKFSIFTKLTYLVFVILILIVMLRLLYPASILNKIDADLLVKLVCISGVLVLSVLSFKR